jgi:hypothetical protein
MPLVNVMVNGRAYTGGIGQEKCAAVFHRPCGQEKKEARQCLS